MGERGCVYKLLIKLWYTLGNETLKFNDRGVWGIFIKVCISVVQLIIFHYILFIVLPTIGKNL